MIQAQPGSGGGDAGGEGVEGAVRRRLYAMGVVGTSSVAIDEAASDLSRWDPPARPILPPPRKKAEIVISIKRLGSFVWIVEILPDLLQ